MNQTNSSHNFYGILLIKNLELTAEAKYVLFHIYKRFENGPVNQQTKSLAKDIGVTDQVLKTARDFLLEKKYLIPVPRISSGGSDRKGRPNISFRVSPDLIATLERLDTSDQHSRASLHKHLHRIDVLMSPHAWANPEPAFMNQKKKIPLQQSGRLRIANRVLLAILFGHADKCGVVRGLGMSKLRELVGMTQERLDSQLKKLTDLGEILCRVSGVSGRYLFSRSPSVFFLNIFNDAIEKKKNYSDLATLILSDFHFENINIGYYWAGNIFNEAFHGGEYFFRRPADTNRLGMDGTVSTQDMENLIEKIRQKFSSRRIFGDIGLNNEIPMVLTRRILDIDFSWTRDFLDFNLQQFFRDTPPVTFIQFFQFKIHEYASTLLTKHWNNLVFDCVMLQETLIEHIKDDIYPNSLRRKASDEDRTKLVAEALGLFIYRIAYVTALHAKCIVRAAFKDRINIPPLANATYAILPVSYGAKVNRLSIAIKLKGKSITERYITLDVKSPTHPIQIEASKTSVEVKDRLKQFGYYPYSE